MCIYKTLITELGVLNIAKKSLKQLCINNKNELPFDFTTKYMFAFDTLIPEYEKKLISVYKKYFTHDEIVDLLNFYDTPIGKKLKKNQHNITMDLFKVGEIISSKLLKLLELEIK